MTEIDKTISMQNIEQQKEISITEQKLTNLTTVTIKLLQELTITELSMNSSSGNRKNSIQAKLRVLSDINSNLAQISKINIQAIEPFVSKEIIIYVRRILGETTMPKIQALQYFRVILVSEKNAYKMIKYGVPVYIARVIQRDETNKKIVSTSNYEDQAFETLRLLSHWVDKFPNSFPQYLGNVLVSFAELPVTSSLDERQRKKDQISQFLKNYMIDIFLNFSSKNTVMCCRCGGFSFLLNEITNSQEKSVEIVNKLLLFINDKKYREITQDYIDLGKVFYVLTDIDNVFMEDNLRNKNNQDGLAKFQTKVTLAKNAIIILMKSWVGLIYLGKNPQILSSLLEAIKQIPRKSQSELRKSIFSCLQQILGIGTAIITSRSNKGQFRISSLIGCFLMSVIELLINENILRILIQLSGVQDEQISEPAQKLLKSITLLIFNFRPESSKYIDILITAASQNISNSSQLLRSSASFVITKISNYIYDKKSKDNHPLFNELQNIFSLKTIFIPYQRASVNSIAKTLNFIAYKQNQNHRKELFEMVPIPKDVKEDYRFWKWKIIEDLLSFPDPEKYRNTTNDRFRENKLYRYLLKFYSPSRGAFSSLHWQKDSFKYHKVGLLLVKNTITIPDNLPLVRNPPQSQFQCTISFIGDLQKFLELSIAEAIENPHNMDLFKTMKRELLGYIGLFSQQKMGFEALLYDNKFFELLYDCVPKKQCAHIVYIILMSLDFYRDDAIKEQKTSQHYLNASLDNSRKFSSDSFQLNPSQIIIGSKALLKQCLKYGSYQLKLAGIQVLKILLMSQLPLFSAYCYRQLFSMLKQSPQQSQVVLNVRELLQKNLRNIKNVEIFITIASESMSQPSNFSKSKSKSSEQIKQHSIRMKSKEPKDKSEEALINQQRKMSYEDKASVSFSEIKHKLSSQIIIRLLSHEKGFDLIEKQFPDWLESQYAIWSPKISKQSKKKKQHYSLKVEKKLGSSLNFNSGKSKHKNFYVISNAQNQSLDTIIYDLLFLYKLPWIVSINGKEYPLWVKQTKSSYVLFRQFQNPERNNTETNKYSKGKQSITTDCFPTVYLNDDNVKIFLSIGAIDIDEYFKEIQLVRESLYQTRKGCLNIFLSINSKQVILFGEKMWFVESNGVQIYYTKGTKGNMNKLYIRRININIEIPYTETSSELPLHLIEALSKTKKGREFIENKNFVENCYQTLALGSKSELENPPLNPQYDLDKDCSPSLVELRSVLWSIGFYGSTNTGIKTLKESKIFDIVIELSRNSYTLSLRGTCRYIMDMFCHSETGRSLLVQNRFYVNSTRYSCYPVDCHSSYNIKTDRNEQNQHFLQDKQYWQFYNKILEYPSTKNEQKLFELISMLISSFSSKVASNQLKQIIRVSPKISNSQNLFQKVITLLTFYKFKHENRRLIMNIFDQFLRSNMLNKKSAIQYKEQKTQLSSIQFYQSHKSLKLYKFYTDHPQNQIQDLKQPKLINIRSERPN